MENERTPGERSPQLSLIVAPALVLRVGLPVIAVLSLASFAGQVLTHGFGVSGGLIGIYVNVTDVDRELSIPTWFQSMVLLVCAAALWTVADDVARAGGRRRRQWRLLAAAFAYLSVDEMVGLHELASLPLRTAFNLDGPLRFAWILVAVPLLIAFAAVLVPFLRELPRPTLATFLISGALYVGGAVGLEMIGGILTERVGMDTIAYSIEAALEELCEMLGMTLFLAGVARYRQSYLLPRPQGADTVHADLRGREYRDGET